MAPLLTFLLHRPLRIEAARTLAGVAVNRALDARQLLLVLVLLIALPFELTNVLRMQSREGDRAGAHFWQLRHGARYKTSARQERIYENKNLAWLIWVKSLGFSGKPGSSFLAIPSLGSTLCPGRGRPRRAATTNGKIL